MLVLKNASNEKTQGVGYGYGEDSGFCGYEDSVEVPRVFLWVWYGYEG